ncbi:MAG: DCC1-like thiol-disulfide oxidoreductase family protein [Cyanobacteria bacterium J06598_3]
MTSVQAKNENRRFAKLRDRYSLDVRSLALLRIGLALVILADLWTRFGDLRAHYSDVGVLPRAVLNDGILKSGYWSLHTLSGLPVVQGGLFLLAALAAIAMLVGYHSRLAVIASWVLLISMHNRNPLLIFAADDVLRAVMFWAMFLPLGAAYSVDRAMNTAIRPVPLRIFSGATIALMVQQCFIYIFSAVFKTTNEAWWPDGSAVYYSLSYDQYVTALGHWLLNLGPLLTVFTLVTLVLEWVGPLLIWSPIRNDLCRMIAVVTFISLHAGFGFTLNLGIFPFLSIFTWLAFIPTSFWESLGKRVYGSAGEGITGQGPKRTGLKIYYDADCGFCKKVVHLIRMLLVLPHTPLATAQSIPEINEAMETQNSWVIVDWQGKHHYKFEGIAYVVSLSPVVGWFARVLRWAPVMTVGTTFYEWIANNRRTAGTFTRPFKFKPLTVKTPGWLSAIALLLLSLTFIWNLRSIVTHRAFVDSQQPAVSMIRRVTNSRTAQRIDWLSQVTRLDQSWSIFAPGPPLDDGWHVVTGTPVADEQGAGNVADASSIDVLRPSRAVSFEKPTLGDRARFYKNMQWRTFYINLNRFIGQKVFGDYGNYLCRQSGRQGHPLADLQVYFMEERTAPPGEPQSVEKKLIWEQTCPVTKA